MSKYHGHILHFNRTSSHYPETLEYHSSWAKSADVTCTSNVFLSGKITEQSQNHRNKMIFLLIYKICMCNRTVNQSSHAQDN